MRWGGEGEEVEEEDAESRVIAACERVITMPGKGKVRTMQEILPSCTTVNEESCSSYKDKGAF